MITAVLQSREIPINLPTDKITSEGVGVIILIGIVLFFTYKVCSLLCKHKKGD